jgi:hypothetical protein
MLTTLADAALPSCMVASPAMVLLLYPIVLIEAAVIRRMVKPEPARPRRLATITNLWSTFAGVPMAYIGAYIVLENATPGPYASASLVGKIVWLLGSGAILGTDDRSRVWMFWTGALLIHVGLCAASILVEWLVLRWLLRGTDSRGMVKATIVGNILTYAMLPVGYVVIVLGLSVIMD